jgi:uncharacterized protein YjbI with pentapeptide repeats
MQTRYKITKNTIVKNGITLMQIACVATGDLLGYVEDIASIKSNDVIIVNQDVFIFKNSVLHGGDFHGGDFHGGYFYAGYFHGGDFHGGVFRGGYFHGGYFRGGYFHAGYFYGGDFHAGYFYGGDFHAGYFHGGDFHGGVFRGGVFRGGDFHGGVFHGGDFLVFNPIGSENGVLTIYPRDGSFEITRGCFKGTPKEFKAAVKETHKNIKTAKIYMAALEMCELKFGKKNFWKE